MPNPVDTPKAAMKEADPSPPGNLIPRDPEGQQLLPGDDSMGPTGEG
jgi:hypothetical protein